MTRRESPVNPLSAVSAKSPGLAGLNLSRASMPPKSDAMNLLPTRRATGRISGLAALVFGLGVSACADTLDQIEVLETNDTRVLVRHDGENGRLSKQFSHGFEAARFQDLFVPGDWTTMTLQSPDMPRVEDYAALRKRILDGAADFADNRITVERADVFEGRGAARFTAFAPKRGMITSKSDVQKTDMWFTQGDDLWFQAAFKLVDGQPYSLVDFEDRQKRGGPGPRIVIHGDGNLGYELKSPPKPRLRQTLAKVPRDTWFVLTVHLKLDARRGHARIWQNDLLVIDALVRTLPSKGALLNSLELGITATQEDAVLLVDAVKHGHQPLKP